MFRYISLRFSLPFLLFFHPLPPTSLRNGASFSFLGVSEINCNDFRRVWPKCKKKNTQREIETESRRDLFGAIFHQRVRMQFRRVHRKLTAEHLFLSSSIRIARTHMHRHVCLSSRFSVWRLKMWNFISACKSNKMCSISMRCMIFIATDVITLCHALMQTCH